MVMPACNSFTTSLIHQYTIFTHIQDNCSQLNTQNMQGERVCGLLNAYEVKHIVH